MLDKIFENRYVCLSFDSERHIFYIKTYPTTEELVLEGYQNMVGEVLAQLQLLPAVRCILDDSSQNYGITNPHVQRWTAEAFLAVLKPKKTTHYALVMPKDFITSLGIDQIVQESFDIGHSIEVRYFSSVSSAQEWLDTQFSTQ
jgi:hypothetical protein